VDGRSIARVWGEGEERGRRGVVEKNERSDGVEIVVDWGAAREKLGMGGQPETSGFSPSVGEHVRGRPRELEEGI
jgi:hypothetical protein